MSDARKCDVSGEYWDLEEDVERNFDIYRDGKRLDIHPKLYKKVENILGVKFLINKLSLSKKKYKNRKDGWRKEEDKIVKENYGKVSEEELLKKVNRSWNAIKCRAFKLGVVKEHSITKVAKIGGNKNGDMLCPKCKSSNIVKRGVRKTKKRGNVQKYQCNDCRYKFSETTDYHRMRESKEVIERAIELYNDGKTAREISKIFKKEGNKISHSTISRWLDKFLMGEKKLRVKKKKWRKASEDQEYAEKLKKDNEYMEKVREEVEQYRCTKCFVNPVIKKGDVCEECRLANDEDENE